MLSDALDSKAASTPPHSGLLVLLVSSPPWMPSGKVQTNTPKGALTKLKAKPWCTSWSFLPLNVPVGFPDSFPHTVLAPKAKHKLVDVSPPRRNCWHLCLPEQPWLKGEEVLESASCPCSQIHRSQQSHWLWLPGDLCPAISQSPHLGRWTYSPLEFPPGTVNFSFSYYFLCQMGGIKTPTHIQICSVLKGLGAPCSVLKGPTYPITKSQTKFTPNKKSSPFGWVKSTFWNVHTLSQQLSFMAVYIG